MLVGNKFPPLPRTQNRVSCSLSQKNNNSLSPYDFLMKARKQHLNHKLSSVPNFSRVSLLGMNKYHLINTAADTSNSIYCQWLSVTLDIIASKTFQITNKQAKSKLQESTIKAEKSFLSKH